MNQYHVLADQKVIGTCSSIDRLSVSNFSHIDSLAAKVSKLSSVTTVLELELAKLTQSRFLCIVFYAVTLFWSYGFGLFFSINHQN